MNKFPYEFKNNYADLIVCNMVLEHIKQPTKAIEEFHRIIKPNGIIEIIVPHFSGLNALMADQHINVFSCWYFDLFKIENRKYWYVTERRFNKVYTKIVFPKGMLAIINISIEYLVNINGLTKKIYEHFFSNIYRANELHVTIIKKVV